MCWLKVPYILVCGMVKSLSAADIEVRWFGHRRDSGYIGKKDVEHGKEKRKTTENIHGSSKGHVGWCGRTRYKGLGELEADDQLPQPLKETAERRRRTELRSKSVITSYELDLIGFILLLTRIINHLVWCCLQPIYNISSHVAIISQKIK